MAAVHVDHAPAVGAPSRLAPPAVEGREAPRLSRAGVGHVDLVADAPVRGERDLRAVRAPVGVAHDGVGPVAHQERVPGRPRAAGGRATPGRSRWRGRPACRPSAEASTWYSVGPRSCARAAPLHPPRGTSQICQRPLRSDREEHAASVVREAGKHVVGGIVREPPGHAARRRDQVEVLVAADHLVVDERPGPLARGAGPAGRRRRMRGERAHAGIRRRGGRPGAAGPSGARLSARPPSRRRVPASPWPARPASS